MGRRMRGGDDSFFGDVAAAGVGAYVAKNSTSWGSLFWGLAKVGLVILAVSIVFALIVKMFSKETFIPTPSPEQDKKYVTPAGNVITY